MVHSSLVHAHGLSILWILLACHGFPALAMALKVSSHAVVNATIFGSPSSWIPVWLVVHSMAGW
jgi:hypothetical protein